MVEKINYTEEYLKELDEQIKMIPLTFDPVFKGVFERNLNLLKRFLIIVLDLGLNLEDCKIKLLSKELLKENHKEYRKTIDIYILLNENIYVELEINRSSFEKVKLRNYLYGSKLYSMLIETGEDVKYLRNMYFYQLNLNTEDKSIPYGEDIIVPYGLKTKNIYIANHYTVLKYLEFYRNLYYTKGEKLSEEEMWLAALTARNFTELNEMLSHVLNDCDKNKLMKEAIRMSKDYFSIHEWEKEKCDELVRLESKRVDHEEGFQEGMEEGLQEGLQEGIALGIEQGIEQTTLENIKKMIQKNLDKSLISEITGKSIEEIKKIERSQ